MKKLLLTGAFNYSEEQVKKLTRLGYSISYIQNELQPLDIDISKFDCVVCNNLFAFNEISKFESLKFIQLTSVGLDRIPINYVNNHNIIIKNAKDVYSIPMAEWVVLKILEIYKKSKSFYELQKKHQWEKQRDLLELTNKTVSIIGFGDVGREIARRLKVFGVHIIGVGRREIQSENLDEYYPIEEINVVLNKSDIVVLTLPHTHETHHLLNENRMKKMKNNSVLINVSRGGLIDQSALIKALSQKKFLGVALDVFDVEPLKKDSLLWNENRVIITPHNSFVSEQNNARMFKLIYKNLEEYAR